MKNEKSNREGVEKIIRSLAISDESIVCRLRFDFFLEMAALTGKRQFPIDDSFRVFYSFQRGSDILAEIAPLSGIHSPRVADDSCFAEMHLRGGLKRR